MLAPVAQQDLPTLLDAMGADTPQTRNSIQKTIGSMQRTAPQLQGDIRQALHMTTPLVSEMATNAGSLDQAIASAGFTSAGHLVSWVSQSHMSPEMKAQLPAVAPPRHPEVFAQLSQSGLMPAASATPTAMTPATGVAGYAPTNADANAVTQLAQVMEQSGAAPHARAAAQSAHNVATILAATGGLESAVALISSPSKARVDSHLVTPQAQMTAALANTYLATAGSSPVAQLPSFEGATTPAHLVGQNPVFAGAAPQPDANANRFAPVFARANALQGIATTNQEWQQIGQGIQQVTQAFAPEQQAIVNEGIHQMAPVFGAMVREAGGYAPLVSRMRSAGVSVQSADRVFAGLVAGYAQERGAMTMTGQGENLSMIQPATLQQVAPQLHQMAQSVLPAAPAESANARSTATPISLAQYGQAIAQARPAPLPEAIGNPALTHLAPPLTRQAVAQVPGFADLPKTDHLVAAIQTVAATMNPPVVDSGEGIPMPQTASPPTRQMAGQALYGRATSVQPAPDIAQQSTFSDGGQHQAAELQIQQQYPNAYVQAVVKGYGGQTGGQAPLSSAPGLQINSGTADVARVTPAHINIAAYIGENIGAGPTQIPHLARTVSELGREAFGTALVGDVIREAEIIGQQTIPPMDRYTRFGAYLSDVIQKHLASRDDLQKRAASQSGSERQPGNDRPATQPKPRGQKR
ncbi:MAG: hypothetical protein HC853_00005 [Anaerolineae bacterium]|nr:hypothetical protein [Anaerolineae bacterium]